LSFVIGPSVNFDGAQEAHVVILISWIFLAAVRRVVNREPSTVH
jgi:hypothetical protein